MFQTKVVEKIKTHILNSTTLFFPKNVPFCKIIKCKTQYCEGGKIEKNEVGGACGAYVGGESCAQGSSGETRGKEIIGETQT